MFPDWLFWVSGLADLLSWLKLQCSWLGVFGIEEISWCSGVDSFLESNGVVL